MAEVRVPASVNSEGRELSPNEHYVEATKVNTDGSMNHTPMESPKAEKSQAHKEGEHDKDGLNPGYARRRASHLKDSEKGTKQSPLHPRTHAKKASKVSSSSPSLERKEGSDVRHNSDSMSQGKSRRRSSIDKYDQAPDHASPVPKFGDWNEKDPSSGDGYTGIFDKVREEKRSSAKKPPLITTDPEFYPDYGSQKSTNQGCACFGWFRK